MMDDICQRLAHGFEHGSRQWFVKYAQNYLRNLMKWIGRRVAGFRRCGHDLNGCFVRQKARKMRW